MNDIITKVKIFFLLIIAIGLSTGCAVQNQFSNNNDNANNVKVNTTNPTKILLVQLYFKPTDGLQVVHSYFFPNLGILFPDVLNRRLFSMENSHDHIKLTSGELAVL